MTAYIQAIGTPAEEELWSSVMFIRGYLAEVKEKRTQLSLLWNNCKGLSEHAGQAAFLTGELSFALEYSSALIYAIFANLNSWL